MKTNGNNKKAFTLIELLVVISIIALLLSILMPSLQRAKFLAGRVVCFNNVKNQYLSQMMYAGDNDGKFAPHTDVNPFYARYGNLGPSDPAPVNPDSQVFNLMRGPYITDAKIMVCPLLRSFGSWWAKTSLVGDTAMTPPGYGAWGDGLDINGNVVANVGSGYMWHANYKSTWGVALEFKFNYFSLGDVSEPKWPNKDSECNASKAFISHCICYNTANQGWVNWGHSGSPQTTFDPTPVFQEMDLASKDNPVGYADGHVETTQKSKIRPRMKMGSLYFHY